MRKFGFFSAFVLIFFIYSATGFAYSESQLPEYQLLFSLDVGYAYNKDMNDDVDDYTLYAEDDLNTYYSPSSYSHKVETTKANLPVGFNIEFRSFWDNIGFGVQVGYHMVKAESKLGGSYPDHDKATSTYELTVVPIVATLYYRVDFESSNSFVLVGGGLGYYFGNLSVELERQDDLLGIWNKRSFDGSQSKIGAHILVEYDYVFDFGLTLFAGLKARYVQFDEFKDGIYYLKNNSGSKFKAGLTGVSLYLGAGASF